MISLGDLVRTGTIETKIDALTLQLDTKIDTLTLQLDQLGRIIMAALDDLTKAQAATKADLATLTGLTTQLLAAFASGSMTPAQAQSLLTEMNSEDATIKTNITSIQTALGTAPGAGAGAVAP
jgi:hypothetical protein